MNHLSAMAGYFDSEFNLTKIISIDNWEHGHSTELSATYEDNIIYSQISMGKILLTKGYLNGKHKYEWTSR